MVSLKTLQEDFRKELETFYAALQLAPPYHSIEKAIFTLSTAVAQQSEADQHRLVTFPSERLRVYRQAFLESGLHKKHRGIIRGLLTNKAKHPASDAHRVFAEVYFDSVSDD